MCPYQFYRENETYYPRLYCRLKDGTVSPYCLFSKKCDKERKYISLDVNDKCQIMKMENKRNIPSDSYFVRTFKQRTNGTYVLYVEVDGAVEKINTSFTEFDSNFIYLSKADGVYIASLTPFETKAKSQRKNTRKKKPVEKEKE